ncbi:hypothetical protein D3C87_78760 [compost metagenome]
MSLVTMKVYVNVYGFCAIQNCLNRSIDYGFGDRTEVSIRKTREFKFEVYVPIQTIGQIGVLKKKKSITDINMGQLQAMEKQNILSKIR